MEVNTRYLTKKVYNEKRALRKRDESFILKEDKMYYRVGEGELLTSFTCSWKLSIFTAK